MKVMILMLRQRLIWILGDKMVNNILLKMKRVLGVGLSLFMIETSIFNSVALAATSEANTGFAAYLTTTTKNQVGDTININFAGDNVNLTSTSIRNGADIKWYRSSSGSYEDGELITGEIENIYKLTDADVGYSFFAEATTNAWTNNTETITYRTEITIPVVNNTEPTEDEKVWLTDGDWEYAMLEDGTAEIRAKRQNDDGTRFNMGGDDRNSIVSIDVPSTIGGISVTKLADNAFENCYYDYSKTRYSSIKINLLPDTLIVLGSHVINYAVDTPYSLVLPESVKVIENNSFIRGNIYTFNGGTNEGVPTINKIVFKNPSTHINGGLVETNPSGATSGGIVTYSGAKGSTAENAYYNELNSWIREDLSDPDGRYYKWESVGVYSPDTGLDISGNDNLQLKLEENIKNWEVSQERTDLNKDIIDGTNKLVVKPNDVTDNSVVVIPPELDGQTVGAVELDTTGKNNVVVEISDGVIIDSNSKVDGSTIISGNAGSQAEEFAKDNNLIFENKENEISSKEELDKAKRSQEITSSDGYWKYSFIDGYNGIEIQNIKSFGVDAVVEAPDVIDGHKTSVFKGNRPKQADTKYASIVLPEGIHVINGNIKSGHSYDLGYSKGTTNLTVMDKSADVSTLTKNYAPSTITGWRGSTAEAICIPMESNIGSTFIALDENVSIESVIIDGIAKVGQTLNANISPAGLEVDYKWFMADDVNGTYSEISGAAGTSLELLDEHIDKFIKVEVTNKNNSTDVIVSEPTSKVEKDGGNSGSGDKNENGKKIIDSTETIDYVTEDFTESAFDAEQKRDVEVYASQGQTFTIKIPRKIVLAGSKGSESSAEFETEIKANISGADVIKVEPQNSFFELSESSGVKRPVDCNITLGQTEFSLLTNTQEALENGVVTTHMVTAERLSSGTWSGQFNWVISVSGVQKTDSEPTVK